MAVPSTIERFIERHPSAELFIFICEELAFAAWAPSNRKTANRSESEWKAQLERLLHSLSAPVDKAIAILQDNEMPGVRYARGATNAARVCDALSAALLEQEGPNIGVGVDCALRHDIPAIAIVTVWVDG